MAIVVSRAAQNSYPANVDGGTQDFGWENLNISRFVDAIENEDTTFLNTMKKGSAGSERIERTGMHTITPRGSQVSGAVTATDTNIPVTASHGVRFQQGHVLMVTKSDTNEREIMWVKDDPAADTLPVLRAQGGTTALVFAANDRVVTIGIAMPQLADYPMGPLSTGTTYWNTWQKFNTHLLFSDESRKVKNAEYPSGDALDRAMLRKGKELKWELNKALVMSRRQEGAPSPDAPIPSMFGGLQFFTEQSGNVFTLGTATTLLTIEAIEEALMTLDERYGQNKGKKMLMNPRTKQIFNRILRPAKWQSGVDGNKVDLRWDSVTTEVGEYSFSTDANIPVGEIYIFNPSEMEYAPFEGADWKQKDVPTKGDYTWRGLSGTYTFRPGIVPGYAMIRGFSTKLSDYPKMPVA